MKIGELARRSGLGVHTIRWYESQRLIPGVRRDASGHRAYVAWHVEWLALLDRLKLTGMSIAQIAQYTALVRRGESTLPEQRRIFVAHREQARERVREMQASLAHIDAKIDFFDEWMRTGQRPGVVQRLAAGPRGEAASAGART